MGTWCMVLLAAAVITANPPMQAWASQSCPTTGRRPVTVFYPHKRPTIPCSAALCAAAGPAGTPAPGNGLLAVVSHGSGGDPGCTLTRLRALVQAIVVVLLPEHAGDKPQRPLPPSARRGWKRRPAEVSPCRGRRGADARLAPLLALDSRDVCLPEATPPLVFAGGNGLQPASPAPRGPSGGGFFVLRRLHHPPARQLAGRHQKGRRLSPSFATGL